MVKDNHTTNMSKLTTFFTILFLFLNLSSFSQEKHWVDLMMDRDVNFYEVQEAFNKAWEGREYEKGKGWKQFKRWEWFTEQRVYPSGERYPMHIAFEERQKFEKEYPAFKSKSGSSWEPLGPDDWSAIYTGYNPGIGRVNVVVEHPEDESIIYAGTPSGGLWKTIDGGTNWEPLTDDFSAMGISGIAIDYSDPDVLYVSTGDGNGSDTYSIGVLKSIDGGQTWQTTGMIHTIYENITTRKLIMHPTNPNELFVATNNGLYKTTDAGNEWYLVSSGDMRNVLYHPTDPTIVYASTTSFFRSTDQGESFVHVSDLQTAGTNRMEIAVSPDEPDWVYALTGRNSTQGFRALYLSTDAGVSFQEQTTSPNLFGYALDGSDGGGQSWYDMAIAIDPNNASTLYVGGVNVWKSTNAGVDFEINSHWIYPSSVGYTHADIHSLDFYGENLYCGSDGGIFILKDGGFNWVDLTPTMKISQFYRFGNSQTNPDLIIGGTQDNGSNMRLNDKWIHVLGADGMDAGIQPDNDSVMYCTQQFGNLYRTLDGGQTWDPVMNGNGESGGWVTPLQVLSNDKIVIGYRNLWLSEDNGTFFNRISNFSSGTIRDLAVYEKNHDIIYVATLGRLHKTTNGGESWEAFGSVNGLQSFAISDIEIHADNPDIVWITVSGYNQHDKVFVTEDGGESWENITLNLPNLPANAISHQKGSKGGVYVGMDVGVYYKDSLMDEWQSFDTDMPNVIVNDLEILYNDEVIRAASYGRGIWESPLHENTYSSPTAEFSFTTQQTCERDSIYFNNESFDVNLPGSRDYKWYFEGANPSFSTKENPVVSYSSSGEYEVALVYTTHAGEDSLVKTIDIDMTEYSLDLSIELSSFNENSAWQISDENDSIIFSGNISDFTNQIYETVVCLNFGCYKLTFNDINGDVLLRFNNEDMINEEEVTSSESFSFCFDYNLLFPDFEGEDFVIFPNPTRGSFSIQPLFGDEQFSYKLVDSKGAIIKEDTDVMNKQNIDISKESASKYSLILDKNGSLSKVKLIKLD